MSKKLFKSRQFLSFWRRFAPRRSHDRRAAEKHAFEFGDGGSRRPPFQAKMKNGPANRQPSDLRRLQDTQGDLASRGGERNDGDAEPAATSCLIAPVLPI